MMKKNTHLIYLKNMPFEYIRSWLLALTKAGIRPIGRQLRRKERQMQRDIDAEFTKQKNFVISRMRYVLNKGMCACVECTTKSTKGMIDDIFDDMEDQDMIDKIIVVAGTTMTVGAAYRIKKMRLSEIGINFDLKHPLAVKYLQTQRPLILAKMKDTTKEHIKPILQKAAAEGWSPQETAKLISENFAFSKTRSLMIASNEVGHAYEWGNYSVMKDVEDKGYKVEKAWETVGDDRVTEICLDNQRDGYIKYGDKFSSGDETAPTQEHPNCRCTTLYQYQ